jgi:futalosine hydrolase
LPRLFLINLQIKFHLAILSYLCLVNFKELSTQKRILLVLASKNEVPFSLSDGAQSLYTISLNDIYVDVLISGIGAVPTIFNLCNVANNYHFIVNAGIAGSFNLDIPLGSVVLVSQDSLADYGIDSNGNFVQIDETQFSNPSQPLRYLTCPYVNRFNKVFPEVNGITLSTVSGSLERIRSLQEKWNADIETMESAAVFYYCLNRNIPFIGVRAISNYVETRNRNAWKVELAVKNLWNALPDIVNTIILNDF